MNPTDEQIEAMHNGAVREAHNRMATTRAAIDVLLLACKECWHRNHGGGCEQAKCSVWRMCRPYDQIQRMRAKGQLDSWNWYEIARNEGRLLFIDDIDGRSPVDTGKGDETKTQHNTPPSVL